MATGVSYEGKVVKVGDQVSIMGAVVSITGSAPSTASVVVAEQFGVYQFTAQANDLTNALNTGAGMGMNGFLFTTADRVTANGQVTAISGSGQAAVLTVTLDHSQFSVTVSAGSCHSNGA